MTNEADGDRARGIARATDQLAERPASPDPGTTPGHDQRGEAIALLIQLDVPQHVSVAVYRLEVGACLVAVCGRCGAGAEIALDACVIPEPLTECSAEWLKDAAVAFGQILDAVRTLRGSWAPGHRACAAPAVEGDTLTAIGEDAAPAVSDRREGDRVH
jgi:hypothetical protein